MKDAPVPARGANFRVGAEGSGSTHDVSATKAKSTTGVGKGDASRAQHAPSPGLVSAEGTEGKPSSLLSGAAWRAALEALVAARVVVGYRYGYPSSGNDLPASPSGTTRSTTEFWRAWSINVVS